MADTGIFATTAEVSRKAGANASTTANVEAYINQFMTEAEAQINAVTRYNWSDAYSSLDVDVKGLLKLAASNLAAMYVIQYDTGGFNSLEEAQTMLDVLWNGYIEAIKLLNDKKVNDFMLGV